MSVKKKQTYSDLINKCYSSNIRYLSVDEERLFTKHAIKIVVETKQKRKMMYAKKEDEASVRNSVVTLNNLDQHNIRMCNPTPGIPGYSPVNKSQLYAENSTNIFDSRINESSEFNLQSSLRPVTLFLITLNIDNKQEKD